MQIVTDSDRDFLAMLGTFAVIIMTSFLIVIATNNMRQDEAEMVAHTVDVTGERPPCVAQVNC